MATETISLEADTWTQVSAAATTAVVVVPNTPGEYSWAFDSTDPTIYGNRFLFGDTLNFNGVTDGLWLKSHGLDAKVSVTGAV